MVLCEVFRNGTKPSFGLTKNNKHKMTKQLKNKAENHCKTLVSRKLIGTAEVKNKIDNKDKKIWFIVLLMN